jgi:tRNA threonylcarbamoyladenosine biosynthesis protein TsaE
MTIEVKSVEDLPSAAKFFLEETDNRKVFAFEGQMGAGKTTFIVSLLKAMGVEDIEGSPTYSLVNTYDSVAFGRINHFDLYRLNSEEEAFDIGIEELLYCGDYCFIEWPSKIENLLPENTIWVRISVNEANERIISVEIE